MSRASVSRTSTSHNGLPLRYVVRTGFTTCSSGFFVSLSRLQCRPLFQTVRHSTTGMPIHGCGILIRGYRLIRASVGGNCRYFALGWPQSYPEDHAESGNEKQHAWTKQFMLAGRLSLFRHNLLFSGLAVGLSLLACLPFFLASSFSLHRERLYSRHLDGRAAVGSTWFSVASPSASRFRPSS